MAVEGAEWRGEKDGPPAKSKEREFRRGEEEEEDRRWGGVAANVLCAGHIRGEPSTADHVKRAGESATRLQTR